jgi:hypothetical protein
MGSFPRGALSKYSNWKSIAIRAVLFAWRTVVAGVPAMARRVGLFMA